MRKLQNKQFADIWVRNVLIKLKEVYNVLVLAVAEIIIGIAVFLYSLYDYMYCGEGKQFQYYALLVMALNLIISICR